MDGTQTLNGSTVGTASYSPLQGWSNTKKYAFFAFYPMPNENVTLVNLDGTPYAGGVPAVKYTNPDLEKSKMVDVMTSPAYIDKFWKSSAEGGNNIPSGEVSFTLQHRLSVLGVKIKNSSEGSITVTSVTLEVSGLLYSDMTMPLDYTSKETKTSSKTNADSALSGTFALSLGSGQTFAVAQTPEYDELSDKLIFIPQTETMTIKATIGYKRNAYDEYSTVESTKTVENLETALAEGQKQMISFNFTDSKVDVSISKGPWSNSYEVDNSFN